MDFFSPAGEQIYKKTRKPQKKSINRLGKNNTYSNVIFKNS